jgi:hypothetical protein
VTVQVLPHCRWGQTKYRHIDRNAPLACEEPYASFRPSFDWWFCRKVTLALPASGADPASTQSL